MGVSLRQTCTDRIKIQRTRPHPLRKAESVVEGAGSDESVECREQIASAKSAESTVQMSAERRVQPQSLGSNFEFPVRFSEGPGLQQIMSCTHAHGVRSNHQHRAHNCALSAGTISSMHTLVLYWRLKSVSCTHVRTRRVHNQRHVHTCAVFQVTTNVVRARVRSWR